MAGLGIRISPPVTLKPKAACMPLARSKRWISPYEQADPQASSAVKVFLSQAAYCRISLHAASEMDDEVGGALVGLWCVDRDTDEQFVVVHVACTSYASRECLSNIYTRYPHRFSR
jgi:hypothetical protein